MRKVLFLIAVIIIMMTDNIFAQNFPLENLSVRIGRPALLQGPYPASPDSPFIPQWFEGFGWVAYRGDVKTATAMAVMGIDQFGRGGFEKPAMTPPWGSNGAWIEGVIRTGPNDFWAVFHTERMEPACKINGIHAAMGIARADNPAGPFVPVKMIADTPDPCGEGNGSFVKWSDGFNYMFFNQSVGPEIMARMNPVDPTDWKKYYCPISNTPGAEDCGFIGVGNEETPIKMNPNFFWIAGGMVASWRGNIFLTSGNNGNWGFGGIPLFISANGYEGTILEDPIFPRFKQDLKTSETAAAFVPQSDAMVYMSIVDPSQADQNRLVDGRNLQLDYAYIQPGGNFWDINTPRYLVGHPLSMEVLPQPTWPNVAVELSRYSSGGDSWSTIVLPTPLGQWNYELSLGFVATRDPGAADKPVKPLCDCAVTVTTTFPISPSPRLNCKKLRCLKGDGDEDQVTVARTVHWNSNDACGGNATNLRILGFLFAGAQPGTHPLYQCQAPAMDLFTSAKADCEGKGFNAGLLGYALDK